MFKKIPTSLEPSWMSLVDQMICIVSIVHQWEIGKQSSSPMMDK